MSIELLEQYDYESNKYLPMHGTDDWVLVGELGDGGGYEWTDFNAFYSPSARRYFWHGDSGCSCNSWIDDLSAAADFQDGDRAALLRAWEVFAKDSYSIDVTEYLNGASTIRDFREPAA